MPRWSIFETSELVAKVHGDGHRSRIDASLYAMSQRQRYARFHYQEVMRLLAEFRDSYLKDEVLLTVTHGQDEEGRAAFAEFMMQSGAHVIACVLSIHSMADVTAFAAYWALGYQGAPNIRREKDVTAASMQPVLAANPEHKGVADALASLMNNAEFKHVAALSNHSKHRGLIRPLLNEDWTGARERPHELRFAGFAYDDVPYLETEITSILGPAYELASATVVNVGNEINSLLSKSGLRVRPNPSFKRTRSGRSLQAFIAFSTLRALPARAA